MRRPDLTLALILLVGVILSIPAPARGALQPGPAEIEVLGADGSPVNRITDGNTIRLRLVLPQPSGADRSVPFMLAGRRSPIATCPLARGEGSCETEALFSLGWYWSEDGAPSPIRRITADLGDSTEVGAVSLQVDPRPVVMVHGFASSWEAWKRYLGASGYLASQGLAGFAVGDGQAPGMMNTGNLADPAARTNTIAENAAVLDAYIDGVKQATGAEQVDLIAHSMGGLIARYYIDRVMGQRDVAQLIMLGSPMAGTDCADLPASLGLYLPATLEIRPGYVSDVFNADVFHRHGVPFRALAGVPILEGFKAPCTDVPTDLAVSLESVTAIPLESRQMPILHTDLNQSEAVFRDFVLPLLHTPPGGFIPTADPPAAPSTGTPFQFSRLFTGHITPGRDQDLTIPIDSGMTLASFALYDSTRSLEVTVRGASGNIIELTPEANGLVVVRDPSTLFYLGYGFQNPKPGAWKVTLRATEATPDDGADYAVAAHFLGGATAEAGLSAILPRIGERVVLTASLGGPSPSPITLSGASAAIRGPAGGQETIRLEINGAQAAGSWEPQAPGVYGVDVTLTGETQDGVTVERTVFLALEAQPRPGLLDRAGFWPMLILILVLCGAALALVVRVRARLGSHGRPKSGR